MQLDQTLLIYVSGEVKEELLTFLAMLLPQVTSVSANASAAIQLTRVLTEFERTIGRIFHRDKPFDGVSEKTQPCTLDSAFLVLTETFPEFYSDAVYRTWYCDLSHRIRHGVSALFGSDGKATAAAGFVEKQGVVLTQVAVLPQLQNQGVGSALVRSAAQPFLKQGKPVFVYSKNYCTDGFYSHLGFVPFEPWYEWKR